MWKLISSLLLVLCVVLGVVLLGQEPALGHGAVHDRFATMSRGGGPQRHDGVLWLGWLYGAVQIGLFVALIALGMRRSSRAVMAAVTVLYLASFTMVIYGYALSGTGTELVLGLPPATAWMLYVLWPGPVLFTVLYCLKFDDWILDPRLAARLAPEESAEANIKEHEGVA